MNISSRESCGPGCTFTAFAIHSPDIIRFVFKSWWYVSSIQRIFETPQGADVGFYGLVFQWLRYIEAWILRSRSETNIARWLGTKSSKPSLFVVTHAFGCTHEPRYISVSARHRDTNHSLLRQSETSSIAEVFIFSLSFCFPFVRGRACSRRDFQERTFIEERKQTKSSRSPAWSKMLYPTANELSEWKKVLV